MGALPKVAWIFREPVKRRWQLGVELIFVIEIWRSAAFGERGSCS